jgi:hypothetical protein
VGSAKERPTDGDARDNVVPTVIEVKEHSQTFYVAPRLFQNLVLQDDDRVG